MFSGPSSTLGAADRAALATLELRCVVPFTRLSTSLVSLGLGTGESITTSISLLVRGALDRDPLVVAPFRAGGSSGVVSD